MFECIGFNPGSRIDIDSQKGATTTPKNYTIKNLKSPAK